MIEISNNIIFNCIFIVINQITIWYNNKNTKKRLKVSFDDIVEIKIIPNNEQLSYMYNDLMVIQYINSPKIKILDSSDDFDFFVYFD